MMIDLGQDVARCVPRASNSSTGGVTQGYVAGQIRHLLCRALVTRTNSFEVRLKTQRKVQRQQTLALNQ